MPFSCDIYEKSLICKFGGKSTLINNSKGVSLNQESL